MKYIDTNIFLRALARDHPEMTAASEALFGHISRGAEKAIVLEAVVAEAIYVLMSPNLYRQSRQQVVAGLTPLISLGGIEMEDKRRCLSALSLFAEFPSLGFIDALVAAAVLGSDADEVISFDGKIARATGARVVEP